MWLLGSQLQLGPQPAHLLLCSRIAFGLYVRLQLAPGLACIGQILQFHIAERGRIQLAGLLQSGQLCKLRQLRLRGPLAQPVGAWAAQNACPGRHHGVFHRRLGRLGLVVGHPCLHVGHALGGQRVAAQIGPAAVVVQAAGMLKLGKHADGALRGKACRGQQAVANAVSFAFHAARKTQLVLNGRCLAPQNQCISGIRAFAGSQRTQNHPGDQQWRALFLFANHACNVALGDVGQLVCHDGGQLIAAGYRTDQAQMHAQITTGQGKGVDAFIATQQNLPGKTLFQLWRHVSTCLGRLYQRLPDAHHISLQLRIVNVVRVAVQRADDAVPQAALFTAGDLCAVAHIGQRQLCVRGRAMPQRRTQGQYQQTFAQCWRSQTSESSHHGQQKGAGPSEARTGSYDACIATMFPALHVFDMDCLSRSPHQLTGRDPL